MQACSSIRITRTHVHRINAARECVFPLLCPVRELEYLVDWDAAIVFSESGVAEKGCVFQTPNEGGDPTTWIITEHDAARGRIQFAMVTPGSHASTLDVTLASTADDTTAVTFTYTSTALTDHGRKFLENATEELFAQRMATFERSLNEYLASHRDDKA